MALDRLGDWRRFSRQMERHIVQYTIPQYFNEDTQTDQVGMWTSEQCVTQMKRYINRAGKRLRGDREELRDMLKIAHYAQFAYDKLKSEMHLVGDIYDNTSEDTDSATLAGILGNK